MDIKDAYDELMDLNILYTVLEDELMDKENEFINTREEIKELIEKFPSLGGYSNVD